MNKLATWSGRAAVLASIFLAACGGNSGGSDSTQVRVVNATQSHATLNLLANTSSALTGTALDTASVYVSVPAGSPTLQINDGTTSAVLATVAPTLAKDSHNTLLVYESGGVVRTAVANEDTAAPATGTAQMRVFNAASDAGGIDVYVTDPATDITTLSTPTFTFSASTDVASRPYLSLTAGTFRIRVTGQGNTTDLRLDIPSVTLASQQLATLILTPTLGGTLVNGGVELQQGAFTASRNPNARVRLLADVGGGATIAASAGTTVIAGATLSPAVGSYVLVPATSTPTLTVNGAPLAAPATRPSAGSDATLVAYGNSAGTATTAFIADDNHLPTASTSLKIRLFNGLTNSTAPLNLSADFAQIAVNVAPGTASGYSTIPASPSVRLEVTSNSGTVNLDPALNLSGNFVYTLFLLGDASAPVRVLRRDH